MKNIASFFALASLLVSAIPAAAGDAPRTISVRGEGELKVAPDVALVSLQVRTRAKDAKAAQKANAEEMARVSKVLRGDFGLEAKEIQTAGFSVNPEYRWQRDGKRVFLGYEAFHSLNARVKKLEKVGELLDKLTSGKAGDERAVLLQGVSFDSDKRRDHETEALGLAMANAQGRAAALAGFAKKGLKGVLRISDSSVSYQPFQPAMRGEAKMMAMDAAPGGAPSTEISAGEITISSNVAVEYEMD
jgi:uncharacterized protein